MEGAPIEKIEHERTVDELIEFRFNQSNSSRLAEYITGIRPDDPKMAERIVEDQSIIRAKYGLPPREGAFEDITEYERFLRARAKEIGVSVRTKSECGTFFEDSRMADGVYFSGRKVIGTTMNNESYDKYAKSIVTLEHEYIHAEQERSAARMPIELMEYEAYVAGLNKKFILKKPEDIDWVVFQFFIGGSVWHWYKERNSNKKENDPEVVPVWKEPEYFLRNVDKVDQKLIDDYKSRVSQ